MKFLSPPIPRLSVPDESGSVIDMTNAGAIAKGIVGSGSTLLAVIGSTIDGIETWLRITALVVGGIIVPLVTSWSILLTIKAKQEYNRRKRNGDHEKR